MRYLEQNLIAHWQMSEINPQDIAPPGEYLKKGLIAHYKCNENDASTDVVDSIGGNTGTYSDGGGAINTSTGSVAGKINTALDFDGDEFADASISTISSSYPLSICAWVKTVSGGYAVFVGTNTTYDQHHVLRISSGIPSAYSRDSSGTGNGAGTTTVTDGNWHHLVAVFKSPTLREIYVDGVKEGSDTTEVDPTTFDTIGLGRSSDSSPDGYYTGSLDDVRIYNRVLSPEEITALYNADNGTEGYGRHNGTGVGIASSNLVNGIAGGLGTDFNGVNEYIVCNEMDQLNFGSGEFSCSFWFKWKNSGVKDYIISKRNDDVIADPGYIFEIRDTNVLGCTLSDGANEDEVSGAITVNDETWHFAVFSIGESLIQIFLDGEVDQSGFSRTAGDLDNSENLTIAVNSGITGGLYTGVLDEIMIFNTALTQSQVMDLYERTRRGSI